MKRFFTNISSRIHVITVITLLITVIASFIAPKSSFSQIESLTIGNYQLVSKQRVGRTTYDYIFRADVTNSGTEDAVSVSADLTSLASTMTVIEGHLAFVDIPAGSTATSTDTCTIRIDRRYPFNETYLSCIFDATFVGSGTDNDDDGYISVQSGGDDCDDTNPNIHPGAAEVCDGVDNNCDGQIDEGVKNTYYADTDSDGFGDPDNTVQYCTLPSGYVADNADCDDTDPAINPDSTEVCDNRDNNCDGLIDEGVKTTYYADTDGDGYGDSNNTTQDCSLPSGYVADNTDCNDSNAGINPGYSDIPGNGIDENCDGTEPPLVTITSPETLTTVGSSPISVSGTVDKPDATVTVNGVNATVSDGSFTISGITLTEGGNVIRATAIDSTDNVSTAHATIYFDSTPPNVNISSPADGFVATSSPITVTGSIFDTVKGTVNENNATVQVNGVTASVSNKTFMLQDLPLVEGENVITAIAADQTGNTDSTSINVTLDLTANKKIEMLSGSNQTGTIGSQLPGPLLVLLKGADGNPASNETVIFKVTQNNGQISGNSGTASSLAEITDANGIAFVSHTLGSTSGVGNNKVEATAVGFTGKVVFTASATEKPPHKINIGSGNNQRGAVNTPLPNPLVAVVTDDGHNVLKGIPVTFAVAGGGGNINGSQSVVVNTDSDGRATVSFALGPVAGLDNNQVQVDFAGNATGAAVFRASGLSIGDPGDTKISGLVLDNSNIPIPGVTVRVEGTTRQGVTDSEGQFLIDSVPVGPLHVIVDGSTATVSGEYPVLSFEIDTVAGQDNTPGMPIYLLPLNTSNTQYVGGSDNVVYTLQNIPGFSLSVKANSVTFPDGLNEGFISVTQVHADKIPMEPPNGLQPRFIITIQPPGAVFDPPAPITIPNVDGLTPGDITEMYSFDHDLGQFVSIGTGTVSEDGMVIASGPGSGVIKAGWHCGGNPATSGCSHNCPVCKTCNQSCDCVPDNSQSPPQRAASDCKQEVCQDGSIDTVADDDDIKPDDAKCKKCEEMKLVADASKNGKKCGDGSVEQECLECQDGECTLPDCDASPVKVTLSLEKNDLFKKFFTNVSKAASSAIPILNIVVEPAVSGKETAGEECCKDCTKLIEKGNYIELSGDADISLSGSAGPAIPPIEYEFSIAKFGYVLQAKVEIEAGITINLDGKVAGTANGRYNVTCNEGCIGINGSGSIALSGSAGAEIGALNVVVTDDSGAKIKIVDVDGTEVTAKLFLGSLGISGGVSKGNGCPIDKCIWSVGEGKFVAVASGGKVTIFNFKIFELKGYRFEYMLWKKLSGSCS